MIMSRRVFLRGAAVAGATVAAGETAIGLRRRCTAF